VIDATTVRNNTVVSRGPAEVQDREKHGTNNENKVPAQRRWERGAPRHVARVGKDESDNQSNDRKEWYYRWRPYRVGDDRDEDFPIRILHGNSRAGRCYYNGGAAQRATTDYVHEANKQQKKE
jgi:hypothetical protein